MSQPTLRVIGSKNKRRRWIVGGVLAALLVIGAGGVTLERLRTDGTPAASVTANSDLHYTGHISLTPPSLDAAVHGFYWENKIQIGVPLK